jgi:hypothetical protein
MARHSIEGNAMRNFKRLVLVLLTMALGGLGGAVASADELTSDAYPVVLTGARESEFYDEITTTAGTFRCTDPTYSATVTKAATSVLVTPDFSSANCTAFGIAVPITTNGCTYKFNVEGGAATTGDADLVCPAGSELTIQLLPGCTIHVKEQSDIGGTVTYINTGSGTTKEITVSANLTGIDYTHTSKPGGGCGTGSATNGALKAKAIVTGETHEGSHVGLSLSSG